MNLYYSFFCSRNIELIFLSFTCCGRYLSNIFKINVFLCKPNHNARLSKGIHDHITLGITVLCAFSVIFIYILYNLMPVSKATDIDKMIIYSQINNKCNIRVVIATRKWRLCRATGNNCKINNVISSI